MNDKDILWWSHGGTLHGESYKRFKLLHDIMCETPGIGLRPYENSGWDEVCAVPEATIQNRYLEHDCGRQRSIQGKI